MSVNNDTGKYFVTSGAIIAISILVGAGICTPAACLHHTLATSKIIALLSVGGSVCIFGAVVGLVVMEYPLIKLASKQLKQEKEQERIESLAKKGLNINNSDCK